MPPALPQVPGLDEDLPEAPRNDDSADLLPAEPDDAGPAEAGGPGSTGAGAECAVPGKALRQMVLVLVPAASGMAAGLGCAWTSRGTLAAERASLWALDLSRQVARDEPLGSGGSSSARRAAGRLKFDSYPPLSG